jgi:ATP-dependent DNA ligase
MIQTASDAGNAAGLAYFIFDLLHLDGDDIGAMPLIERKTRLTELLSDVGPPLHYSDYHRSRGRLSTSRESVSRGHSPFAPRRPLQAPVWSDSKGLGVRQRSPSREQPQGN